MVFFFFKCENFVKYLCSWGSLKRDCESGYSWGGLEKKILVLKEKCFVVD